MEPPSTPDQDKNNSTEICYFEWDKLSLEAISSVGSHVKGANIAGYHTLEVSKQIF